VCVCVPGHVIKLQVTSLLQIAHANRRVIEKSKIFVQRARIKKKKIVSNFDWNFFFNHDSYTPKEEHEGKVVTIATKASKVTTVTGWSLNL